MPHLLTTEIECPEGIECEQCPHHFICWEYDWEEIEQNLVEKFENLTMEELNHEH